MGWKPVELDDYRKLSEIERTAAFAELCKMYDEVTGQLHLVTEQWLACSCRDQCPREEGNHETDQQ